MQHISIGGRAALLACAALALFGCGPSLLPPVRGRLVSVETGQGISGAMLFRSYSLTNYLAVMGEPAGLNVTLDSAMTDASGHFRFSGRLRWFGPGLFADSSAYVQWVHPDWGWGGFSTSELRGNDLAVTRNDKQVRFLSILPVHREPWEAPCELDRNDQALADCNAFAFSKASPEPPRPVPAPAPSSAGWHTGPDGLLVYGGSHYAEPGAGADAPLPEGDDAGDRDRSGPRGQ
jgi:hypothetical protein